MSIVLEICPLNLLRLLEYFPFRSFDQNHNSSFLLSFLLIVGYILSSYLSSNIITCLKDVTATDWNSKHLVLLPLNKKVFVSNPNFHEKKYSTCEALDEN